MQNNAEQKMSTFLNFGGQYQKIIFNQEKIDSLEREGIENITRMFDDFKISKAFEKLQHYIENAKNDQEKGKYLFIKYLFLFEMNEEEAIDIFKRLKKENIPNYLLERYFFNDYLICKNEESKTKLILEYDHNYKEFEKMDCYNNGEYDKCISLVENEESSINILSKIQLIIQKVKSEISDTEIEEIFILKEKIEKTNISKIEKLKIDFMCVALLLILAFERYGIEQYQENIEKFITDVESFDIFKIKKYNFIKKIINIYLSSSIYLYGLLDTKEKLKENKKILDKNNTLNLKLLDGIKLDEIMSEIYIEKNENDLGLAVDIFIECEESEKALEILEEHCKNIEINDELKFKTIILKIELNKKIEKKEEDFLIERMENNAVYKYFYNKIRSDSIEIENVEEIVSSKKAPFFIVRDIVVNVTQDYSVKNEIVFLYKKKYPMLILEILKKYESDDKASGEEFKNLCNKLTESEKNNNGERIADIFNRFGIDAVEETFEYYLRAWNKEKNERLFSKITPLLLEYKKYNESIHNYFKDSLMNENKDDILYERILYSLYNYNQAIFDINKLLINIINFSEVVSSNFLKNLLCFFNLCSNNKIVIEDRNKIFTIDGERFILNDNNEIKSIGIKTISNAMLLLKKNDITEEIELFSALSQRILFNPKNLGKIPEIKSYDVKKEIDNNDGEALLKKLKEMSGADKREEKIEEYLQKKGVLPIDAIHFDGYYLFYIMDKIIENRSIQRRNYIKFNSFKEKNFLISLESLVLIFQLGILDSFNQDNIFIQKSVFETITENVQKGYSKYIGLLKKIVEIFEDGDKVIDDCKNLSLKDITRENYLYSYAKAFQYVLKENFTYITDDYNKYSAKDTQQFISTVEYLEIKYSDFLLSRKEEDLIQLSNMQRERIVKILSNYKI